MSLPLFQVDAFTNRPFTGNPAVVCLLDDPGDPAWMQDVAREMNLAETAFLQKQADGYNLRWFTPMVEVDLCGHATLASAHVLWEQGHLPTVFNSQSEGASRSTRDNWLSLDGAKFFSERGVFMADLHLQRMAHVLVNYSIGVKKGERLGIRAPSTAGPLVKDIYREALRAGALVETFLALPGWESYDHA